MVIVSSKMGQMNRRAVLMSLQQLGAAARVDWRDELPPCRRGAVRVEFHLHHDDAAEIKASWDLPNKLMALVILALVGSMYLYFTFWLNSPSIPDARTLERTPL